jgi:hypothetical protein
MTKTLRMVSWTVQVGDFAGVDEGQVPGLDVHLLSVLSDHGRASGKDHGGFLAWEVGVDAGVLPARSRGTGSLRRWRRGWARTYW